jgi:gluconate 2-dehydrogenase gamma chain
MRSDTLRRRRFLQAAMSAAAASAISCGRKNPWLFFTIEEAATAAAICERIIPADQDPGGRAAGTVNYIDRQLGGPLAKYRRDYRRGLAATDHTSYSQFGKPFAALAANDQDLLLAAFEEGHVQPDVWRAADARRFFELIRDHTMQGFYGDPRHGGNREYTSWLMLGVPPAPIRGRQLYDLSGEGMARRTRRPRWRSNA